MRIGINVPDDLLKRIEPLKTVTNISQICRDAIRRYVELYEAAKSRAEKDGMQEVAERLSQQQRIVVVDWEALGLEDAKLWAQLATIDDWNYFLHRLEVFEKQGRSPSEDGMPIPRVNGARTFYNRQYEYDIDNGWFDQQIQLDEKTNPYLTARLEYYRGFIYYLIAVWQMVRKKSEVNLKEEISKVTKYKSELRSKMEIPKQLVNDK